MTDVTNDYKIQQISTSSKNTELYIKEVKEAIAGYRLTALKFKRTAVQGFCDKEANRLQALLTNALVKSLTN